MKKSLLLIVIALIMGIVCIPVVASANSEVYTKNQEIAAKVKSLANVKDCVVLSYGSNAIVAIKVINVFSKTSRVKLIGDTQKMVTDNFDEITNVVVTTELSQYVKIEKLNKELESGKGLNGILQRYFNGNNQ